LDPLCLLDIGNYELYNPCDRVLYPDLPPRIHVTALVAAFRELGPYIAFDSPGVLRCVDAATSAASKDPDFLVRALCMCSPVWDACVTIHTLYTLQVHSPDMVDKLAAIARRVFTLMRRLAGNGIGKMYHAMGAHSTPMWGEFSVANAYHLWKEYFTVSTFHLSSAQEVVKARIDAVDPSASVIDYHHSVTLAVQYLRGTPGLRYLYQSVHAGDGAPPPEEAKQGLLDQRHHIAALRKTLGYRKSTATEKEVKMIQIYEERLENAMAECTGPLGKVLLETGDFELL